MNLLRKYWRYLSKSKTNIFATLLAGASSLQLAIPSLNAHLTPGQLTMLGILVAMCIAWLRAKTTEPLDKKVEK